MNENNIKTLIIVMMFIIIGVIIFLQFDDKVEGLLPFLRNQSCPVIVTNLNTSLVPQVLRMLIVIVCGWLW